MYTYEAVYHSFCRINQMQKPLYLIDIAKLDRYREKALGRYEGVPKKYFVSLKQEHIYRSFHQTEQEVVLHTCFHHREVAAEDHRNFHDEELQIDW